MINVDKIMSALFITVMVICVVGLLFVVAVVVKFSVLELMK